MTYTAAETEPLAKRLCVDLPDLHIEVARVWITAESGAFNNPLGVTVVDSHGVRVLAHYSTQLLGIDSAASRVKTLSVYQGIRNSLDGSIKEQALAIIASPWNVRNSPYYRRVFTAAGLLTEIPLNPHVRVIAPFETYTVYKGGIIGHSNRVEPYGTIIPVSPAKETGYMFMGHQLFMRVITGGIYKGLWVVAHGSLLFSEGPD